VKEEMLKPFISSSMNTEFLKILVKITLQLTLLKPVVLWTNSACSAYLLFLILLMILTLEAAGHLTSICGMLVSMEQLVELMI